MADQFDRLCAALSDRYTIERVLRAGGMATEYLAEDVQHRRQVAIKVLPSNIAATLGADRFLPEIDIAAGIVGAEPWQWSAEELGRKSSG